MAKRKPPVLDQANPPGHIQPRRIFLKMEKTFDCKFPKDIKVFMTSSATAFPIERLFHMKNMHNANVFVLIAWAFPFTKFRRQDFYTL